MASTTKTGETFYKTPLGEYEPSYGLGLPGLGKVNAELMAQYSSLTTPERVFGQYLAFGRDRETFLEFLTVECRVVFRGNSTGTAEEIKRALCDTLDAKYEVLKKY